MPRPEGWSGLFWTAFRQSRNAMALVDDPRRHVEVNGAYLKLLGYPRGDLIGHPFYEFVEGGPLLSKEEWEATIARGDFTGEAPIVPSDGSRIAVQFAAHPEVATGRRLILFVALGVSSVGGRFRRQIPAEADAQPLSNREREIVRLVSLGSTGPEIAQELQISHDTVRTHVRNAMIKVGARSRAQLVAKSLANGHALR